MGGSRGAGSPPVPRPLPLASADGDLDVLGAVLVRHKHGVWHRHGDDVLKPHRDKVLGVTSRLQQSVLAVERRGRPTRHDAGAVSSPSRQMACQSPKSDHEPP